MSNDKDRLEELDKLECCVANVIHHIILGDFTEDDILSELSTKETLRRAYCLLQNDDNARKLKYQEAENVPV